MKPHRAARAATISGIAQGMSVIVRKKRRPENFILSIRASAIPRMMWKAMEITVKINVNSRDARILSSWNIAI